MPRPNHGSKIGDIRRLAPVWLLLGAGLLAAPVWAGQGVPPILRFSVQDTGGNFFPKGEMEFCLDGQCLYADVDLGFPGHFVVPSQELVPGATYSVMVFDPDVDVVYEMWDWVYVPADYVPGYDRLLGVDKFDIYPQFRGQPDGRLTFRITNTLNPEWERRAGLKMAEDRPDSTPAYPRLISSFQVPNMLGARFKSDPEAAGGVLGVSPGVGLALSWRKGYPRRLNRLEKWVPFRELTFAYAGNRYETDEVLTPGRTSDVTFHRLTVAYGVGRLSPAQANQWSVGVAVGLGAVMDGPETLEYLGRRYRMFGFGGQGRFIREVYGRGLVKVGLLGQVDVMYYPADTGDDDFWHGLASSVSVGVAFY